MEYKGYEIVEDKSTGVWVIFQDFPTVGKQVVELAETQAEAKKKVDQLIAGELLPIFYHNLRSR